MTGKIKDLTDQIGISLPEGKLFSALRHTSYVNEADEDLRSNERLEFLGDAVIDLAVSHHLFRSWADKDEGELSKIKSIVVSQPVLAAKAEELGLGEKVFLGKGEEESGGRSKPSILCDAFEALVGVIFDEKGFGPASTFVVDALQDKIDEVAGRQRVLDYKSSLQIETQKRYDSYPIYEVIEEKGKAHNKTYQVAARIDDRKGLGRGRSKQEAEQAAAKQLYLKITREEDATPTKQ